MSFYEDRILPHMINYALGSKDCLRLREKVCANLSGTVLEVGFGSGLNLPYLPDTVDKLYALDPAHLGRKLAADRLAACDFEVEFIDLEANSYPLEDASVESILSTWTLCTIPNLDGALQEMRRILKPEGQFVFLEHGLADNPGTRKWQQRLNGVQRKIGGGCNLNRSIAATIETAGFNITQLQNYYMKGPKPYTYMYQGIAALPA
ncbi:MAG: class I SAM-dependent methyltransferase [Pseudomonadales bacterium]